MRVALLLATAAAAVAASLPVPPFYRALALQSPCMNGSDVWVYQNLLARWSREVPAPSGCFDDPTQFATLAFQRGARGALLDAPLSGV